MATRDFITLKRFFNSHSKFLLSGFALLGCQMGVGCHPFDDSVPEDTRRPPKVVDNSTAPPPVEGMIRIKSRDSTVFLGSDDPMSQPFDELPRMPVTFQYEFLMDSTEVTQGEWERVIGKAVDADIQTGIGEHLPVYKTTWFDAILYCNAKSRILGLDTVYAYSAAQRDAKLHAIGLSNLEIHLENLGIRLPTEAEWHYAASNGGQTDRPWSGPAPDEDAWFSGNSQGHVHPVGSKRPNSLGLRDMLGNVMEWVSDWKGGFRNEQVADYAGALYPSQLEEKVIKGGAYLSSVGQLRAGSRSFIYPVAAGSALPFVGFRCALGRIPSPQFLTINHSATTADDAVTGLIPDFHRLVGSPLVRIAWLRPIGGRQSKFQVLEINNGKIALQDWPGSDPIVSPVFSPDGEWIAFGSQFEGSKDPGNVTVTHWDFSGAPFTLAQSCIPRWHVDPVHSDTFLIVASSPMDNTESGFASSQTWKYRISGGKPQLPGQLMSQGGFHDGVSPDGNYLATGYRHLRVTKVQDGLASGNLRTLFTKPENGKPQEDTSQVCNVSRRQKTESPEILFLDFGATKGSTLVGRPYGIHEIAFLTEPSGTILKHYWPPKDYLSFEDIESTNSSKFAVTVLKDTKEQDNTLALLEFESGSVRPVLNARGIVQPAMWIRNDPDYQTMVASGMADSLGRYDEPYVQLQQKGYSAKVQLFHRNRERVEVIALGSSHMDFGFIPSQIQKRYCLNLSISGSQHQSSLQILEHIVLPHASRLRAVVFEVMPALFAYPFEDPNFTGSVLQSKGYRYDVDHGFFRDSLPRGFDEALSAVPFTWWLPFDSLGGTHMPSQEIQYDSLPLNPVAPAGLENPQVQANLEVFRFLIQKMDSLRIPILLVETPKEAGYSAMGNGYASYIGPSIQDEAGILEKIRAMCATSSMCGFYDAHKAGQHDFSGNDFYDYDHLSYVGGLRFSSKVDSALANLLNR
jgi:formylglycine-generating enzyme required for sulfatase activity